MIELLGYQGKMFSTSKQAIAPLPPFVATVVLCLGATPREAVTAAPSLTSCGRCRQILGGQSYPKEFLNLGS